MKKTWKKILTILLAFLLAIPIGTKVFADDDEHDREHGENRFEQYEESDDDDHERAPENQNSYNAETSQDYWNIWSREARNNVNNILPINSPGTVKVLIDTKETNFFLIPENGQLLVSCEAIISALGGTVKLYPQSKICILTMGTHELIVRAGSNAAYENSVKTPMPTSAKAYEDTVYIPISAAANSMGYRVLWNENKKMLVFQSIKGA